MSGALKPSQISQGGKDRGCYILGKLCELWGCEPVNACGAVGCFYCESTCDPAQYNKAEKNGTFKGSVANGEGYGAGLAQWSLTWKKNIQTMMNRFTPIETWTMDLQIEIIRKTCKEKFVNLLKQCNDATSSTDIWLRGYENGGGGNGNLCTVEHINKYTWCGGYAGAMSGRATAAYEILKEYMGGNIGEDVRGDIATIAADADSGGYTAPAAISASGLISTDGRSNIYGGLNTDTNSTVKHTRIYEAFSSTLKLNTMEMNIDGSLSSIDKNTNNTDNTNTSTGDAGTSTIEEELGRSSGAGNESLLAAGVAYPVILINDYMVNPETINKFVISSTGFVPTVELVFTSRDKELMKANAIKDGDIMSVFIAPSQAAFKSLRCDFLITSFISPIMRLANADAEYTYRIYGELYVSNLYNANLTFSYAGTSRDALMHAAEQLKLGFFFNDPENTEDSQMWYCTTNTNSEEKELRPSNMKAFIKDTTLHAWKNFESFFDSWIDIRYGLTFLNINKQLGEDGPDEEIDFTPWQSALINNRQVEGHRANMTPDEDKKLQSSGNTKPAFKLISNIVEDDTNTNTYFCTNYEVYNQSGEISREMGVNVLVNYVIDNQGVDSTNNNFTMNYSIPYNDWKMQNGFYMLIGPGKNTTYTPGDSFSEFVDTNNVKVGGKTTDIQADSDANTITLSGNNMLSTGAVNKFYDAATEHNRINNLLLLKKYVKFTLNGANFGIMRGEKIPAMIVNMSMINKALKTNNSNDIIVSNYVEEDLSGWFIIDGLKYIYNPAASDAGSAWKTEIKCIRREWPISGKSLYKAPDDEIKTTIDPTTSNAVTDNSATQTKETTIDNDIDDEQTDSNNVATSGLETYMVTLWNTIKAVDPDNAVTLVQGKWYAVDKNGQKDWGLPYIVNGGLYKVMDEKGDIRYINTTIWDHFYGRAMNLSHSNGISALMSLVLTNESILNVMYKYGISAYEEIWKSGSIEAKTLHFGTSTVRQAEFWNSVFVANTEYKRMYGDYLAHNLYSKLPDKIHEDIDEKTLENGG